jgi:hypothetical protein
MEDSAVLYYLHKRGREKIHWGKIEHLEKTGIFGSK